MVLLVAADEVFAALANSVRRELLHLLADGSRTAGALASEFDLSRPAVSEHLHILEEASLVVGVKRGRERHYHVNPEPFSEITDWLHPFERYWRARLTDLARIMEEPQ
jgi:DNA-binding transcriptional ArsR family regulator